MTTKEALARSRGRIRSAQWGLLGAFTLIGCALLVLPVGRSHFRSELLHAAYVVLLSAGAAGAAWGTWLRFRMDGTSRAWLLSAAFGALSLVFLPHALFAGSGNDPVHEFYGPASRLVFGVLLIAAMSPLPVPSVLRRPRTTALVLGLAVVAVVALVMRGDFVQAMLEPDPARTNRAIEGAALVAITIAVLQFVVKWVRTRRRILITWITGVAAVGVASALLLPADGWELRWWWAQLGLLVAYGVFVLGTDRQMFRAIDEGELRLVYQPKVDLRTDELVSVEALLRWQHPDHGLVPAGDFIPFAEATDLISSFTHWAIGEAAAQHRRWAESGMTIPVAVNVPAQLLRDSRLLDHIKAVLADHGLDPSALTLELTESTSLTSEETGAETLAALAAFGLRIAVDDFGTGYSSLSYLRSLPIKEVKLDRSFVAPMASSPDDYTIVSSTLQMVHGLGLSVVAEGIEDEEVAELLTGLGCALGQGYLWSRPLPADELFRWAQDRTPHPRRRRDRSTQGSEAAPDHQSSPRPERGAEQQPDPPQPAVQDGERTDPESGAVEHGNRDRREQPPPFPRDLSSRAEDRGPHHVGDEGAAQENRSSHQPSGG